MNSERRESELNYTIEKEREQNKPSPPAEKEDHNTADLTHYYASTAHKVEESGLKQKELPGAQNLSGQGLGADLAHDQARVAEVAGVSADATGFDRATRGMPLEHQQDQHMENEEAPLSQAVAPSAC